MTDATAHLAAAFGIEIECYLPEGESQQSAARAVAQRIGKPVEVEGYNHYLRTNWKVVTDGSLGDTSRGLEFVSPKLYGEAGLAEVERVCEALTDFGCTVSKKCGLHVHVDAAGQTLAFWKNIVKLYATFEPVIDSTMPLSRRAGANIFCRSMTAVSMIEIERAESFTTVAEIANPLHVRSDRRYHKLNLQAYSRHSTVEFRQHSGTVDGIKARRWVVTCLKMVAAAKGELSLGTSSPVSTLNRARPGSKAHRIGEMFLRPEGVTGPEVMAAMGWPSVSMPQQAKAAGIEYTSVRTGRMVRYFARRAEAATSTVAITIEGFAATIGATQDETAYMNQRAANLSGTVAWAA